MSIPRCGQSRATAALLACVLAGSAWGQAAPTPPEPQTLAKGVWLIEGSFLPNRQPDGNTVVFRGSQGLVVIDTGRHLWQRQAILALAKAQDAPIVAIVNSHWHLDHVSGNPDLKAAYPAARVYASNAIDDALAGFLKDSAADANAYLKSATLPPETVEDIHNDLATTANGAALRPDDPIRASGVRTLAGRRLQVNLARHGPTAGDVWVVDPQSGVAAVGDLVTLPVPFLDTACVAGWKSALAQVAASPFETLVPGHGKPMNRDEFARYRRAFEAFVDCAISTQGKDACATAWTQSVGSLLRINSIDPRRAERMASYYVEEVLRPHGGNSKFCKASH